MKILVSTVLLSLSAACAGAQGSPAEQTGLALSLSGGTLTVAQGTTGNVAVTLVRGGTTGSVTLSVTGLPTGASATYEQPGTTGAGKVVIAAGNALSGSYPLTVAATDGTNQATAALVLNVSLTAALSGPFQWTSTGPLVSAVPDASHAIVSIKDPSVVFYNNEWHVFATTANTARVWSMVYLHFPDWSKAAAAQPYYIDQTPGYGNKAAPEVFYFRPQNRWYLISEWGPQYSTNDDITKPQNWTPPRDFLATTPPGVDGWIDYWVICDAASCYLFFTNDKGDFFRSRTSIQDFPNGFDNPVVIMHAARNFDLFEASNTYRIKGTNQYLTLIEGISTNGGKRAFRAFVADRLDGAWTPLPNASDWTTPFLGAPNVTFQAGVRAWTADFSHGEMIRDGYDETLTIDPNNMQYLYQGMDVNTPSGLDYSQLPWQLALVRQR